MAQDTASVALLLSRFHVPKPSLGMVSGLMIAVEMASFMGTCSCRAKAVTASGKRASKIFFIFMEVASIALSAQSIFSMDIRDRSRCARVYLVLAAKISSPYATLTGRTRVRLNAMLTTDCGHGLESNDFEHTLPQVSMSGVRWYTTFNGADHGTPLGVISGVGKGIIASSAGLLLKAKGLKVSSIKIDPYINVDAGTMNPREHGEVYVLDDGGEVDLDLGNYERYLNITLGRENNITLGKVFSRVIEQERRGDYLGKTVQVVPHVTGCIEEWITRVAKKPVDDTGEEPDVCIIELGGTVGDIESMPFVEGLCELRRNCAREDFMQIHVSYIPVVHGEQKTKPTQMAIKAVRSAGLLPDLIACRCERPLDATTIDKVARFCQVPNKHVLAVRDMPSTYQVPILLHEQFLSELMASTLQLDKLTLAPKLVQKGLQVWETWQNLTTGLEHLHQDVSIVLVGKYLEQPDSYLSVVRSLEHAAMRCRRRLNITYVDAEALEIQTNKKDPASYHKAWHNVCTAKGILVPGGFGSRGVEGMIRAANWARENNTPYLGICLGMQIAVIEYARNVCNVPLPIANSYEIDAADEDRIIISMPEHHPGQLGGTMRLGLRSTVWQPSTEWSKLRALYGLQNDAINERHRHRYEVNPKYIDSLQEKGLTFIGKDETGIRMEVIELEHHPWFVGVQFHPEYLSRVLEPSKPYLGFIAASASMLDEVTANMASESGRISPIGEQVNGLANGMKSVNSFLDIGTITLPCSRRGSVDLSWEFNLLLPRPLQAASASYFQLRYVTVVDSDQSQTGRSENGRSTAMAQEQKEKDLTCSPLTLLDCLHTFCGACLKEWFAWQATAAADHGRRALHPYTCPSCRDIVRAAKPDWRMTSHLEDYFHAHPDRAKSELEKAELAGQYKPGDDVMPKVAAVREDEEDSEDERVMAGVRELSLADASLSTGRSRARRPRRNDSEEHHVEHQSSLRDLLGASPVNSHDVQQEILQSIHNEGLLDGIDIDNLTIEQEEELTERIAEAYRRRQRRRDRSGNREHHQPLDRSPQPSTAVAAESRPRHERRTNSAASLNVRQNHTPSPGQQTQARAHPPVSRPHLLEQTNQEPRSERRVANASSQWNAISGHRGAERSPTTAPAARSATDLTDRPRTQDGERQRRRRVSTNARSTTDPESEEMRAHIHHLRDAPGSGRQSSVPVRPPGSSRASGEVVHRHTRPTTSSSASSGTAPVESMSQQAIRPAVSYAAFAPEPLSTLQSDDIAPAVRCDRCEKPGIQHELHYHCERCRDGTFNICLACYRNERGCDHWFGFGYRAYDRWRHMTPPQGWPPGYDGPHVLLARRYLRKDESMLPASQNPSPAVERGLQEGAFCDICLSFANDHYWHCQYCLDGAWGHCSSCVQRGKHCTHPLVPVAHFSNLHQPHHDPIKAVRAQLPHLPRDAYALHPAPTDCDICEQPIPPTHTRFHCYHCSHGDYDVCTDCYTSLVARGKISVANGPQGWRRCLHGHRMAVVGYQETSAGGHARVTTRGPVGGWRLKDDAASSALQALPPPDSSLGGRCWARYSRFPAPDVTDELMFPKNAEIREVEERHPEWWVGVYAGTVLLVPSNHVERI
nr:ctp synthase [Quercus suber]